MKLNIFTLSGVILIILSFTAFTTKKSSDTPPKGKFKPSTFNGLKLRSIGPALTSGRIADIAEDIANLTLNNNR